jgi:hypothetical protein
MKKIKNTIKAGALLSGIMFASIFMRAQVPTYQCELKNDSLLTSQVYEFDIYLKNTSAVTFELGNFQAGIILNPLIVNSGNLSALVIEGSSQLSSAQQPSEVMFSMQDNCLKIAPKSPPVYSDGTIIPNSGTGIKVCRIRLTNTVSFGQAKPNLAFNFAVFPYNTIVSAFDRATHLNVNITAAGSHLVSGLGNPLLNGSIAVYTVSGSGSYCQGTPGLPVVLSNSETDIKYSLIKNSVHVGGEITGSGSSLIWSDNPGGTYTVTARRPATYQVVAMSGSAMIIMDDLTAGGSVTGGTTITIGSSTDTLKLQGQLGTVLKWQKQINSAGYADIPATAGLVVYQEIPSSAGTWEYRAVVQNRTCAQQASDPAVVLVSDTYFTRSWVGVVDEKWNKSGNWNPSGVPAGLDDVIIPSSAPFMPVVKVHGLVCNNVLVKAGASVTIVPGFTLTVNGNFILEE